MKPKLSDFMRDKVYPRIDAVDAGFLSNLRPGTLSSNGYYKLTCPACNKGEGFYYPFSSHVRCNRKIECGVSTSIWDVLQKTGMSNKDILATLCSKANVEPPSNDSTGNHNKAESRAPSISPGKAIIQVTQQLAGKNPQILEAFQKERGYSNEDMTAMRLGVYTTVEEVAALLESAGITREVAARKGYLHIDENNPKVLRSGMGGRVIGYWPHPDGDVRIWGRIPTGKGTKTNPKYRFAETLSKDVPYLFSKRRGSFPIGVEGTLDAWALQLLEHWGCALGQASINAAQAAYMVSQGITEAAHMVDGDHAGYEGALSSIRCCESVGITLGIIVLGEGMDDADAMRRNGNGDVLKGLIQKRTNAGEYLARYCSALLSQSPPDLRGVARIQSIARNLTPVSARVWEDMSLSLGIAINDELEAVRILWGMLDAGVPLNQSLEQVSRRTGLSIKFEREAAHG